MQEKYSKIELTRDGLNKEINLIRTRHKISQADFTTNKAALQKKLSALAEKVQKKNQANKSFHNLSVKYKKRVAQSCNPQN